MVIKQRLGFRFYARLPIFDSLNRIFNLAAIITLSDAQQYNYHLKCVTFPAPKHAWEEAWLITKE